MILSVLPSNLLGVTKVNAENSQTEVNQELTNFQTELDSKLAQANKIYSQAQEAQEKLSSQRAKSQNMKAKLLKLKMILFNSRLLSQNKCGQYNQMVGLRSHILMSLRHQKSLRDDYTFDQSECSFDSRG